MNRSDLLAGARDAAPAVPPNIPFGMLFGATAVEVGFGPAQATAMSVFIFAGAAQMAAVELLQADAVMPVVLATAFVLNLRYVVYSASLAPSVRDLPLRWRAVMGYGLFDVNYALAAATFGSGTTPDGEDDAPAPDVHRGWYYVGATLPLVGGLAVGTLAGAVVGRSVGDELSLAFAVPLIFIALVVPMIGDRTTLLTAAVSGVVAVAGAGLPLNLGLLVATGCGVAAGLLHRHVPDWPADGGRA